MIGKNQRELTDICLEIFGQKVIFNKKERRLLSLTDTDLIEFVVKKLNEDNSHLGSGIWNLLFCLVSKTTEYLTVCGWLGISLFPKPEYS